MCTTGMSQKNRFSNLGFMKNIKQKIKMQTTQFYKIKINLQYNY